jgi:hypothetical protein
VRLLEDLQRLLEKSMTPQPADEFFGECTVIGRAQIGSPSGFCLGPILLVFMQGEHFEEDPTKLSIVLTATVVEAGGRASTPRVTGPTLDKRQLLIGWAMPGEDEGNDIARTDAR